MFTIVDIKKNTHIFVGLIDNYLIETMKNLSKIKAILAIVFLIATTIFCISDDIKSMIFFGILSICNLIMSAHLNIIDKIDKLK